MGYTRIEALLNRKGTIISGRAARLWPDTKRRTEEAKNGAGRTKAREGASEAVIRLHREPHISKETKTAAYIDGDEGAAHRMSLKKKKASRN